MQKFLLIEDDDIDAYTLKSSLKKGLNNPFEVEWVTGLKPGLEKIKTETFDLIFLDLGLPDATTPESSIQQVFELAPQTPILVLTGNENYETGLEAVRLGAQEYLVKGIMPVQAICRCVEFAIIRKGVENKLSKQREEAQRKNQFKSLFLASMSHDLRAPLTSILNASPILRNTEDESVKSEVLNVLERAGKTQLKIIDDILDITKLEAGEVKLDFQPMNFVHSVRNIITTLKINAYKKGIQLDYDIADGISKYIMCDDTSLRRILFNLVNNALKFTHQGTVQLSITLDDGLLFQIKDTGIGIPKEKLNDVFKAFEQVNSDKATNTGGAGLGLSICKHRVELLGGSIGVESELGKGSTFYFRIPYQPTDTPEVLEVVSDQPLEKRTVLIADDSVSSRVLLKYLLEGTPFQLSFAKNGQEAVEMFKAGGYDLVLLDMHMDIMNGYEAVSLMREYERQNQLEPTPVIAFTAAVMADEIQKCYDQGCTDILTKPYLRQEIIDKIASYPAAS